MVLNYLHILLEIKFHLVSKINLYYNIFQLIGSLQSIKWNVSYRDKSVTI